MSRRDAAALAGMGPKQRAMRPPIMMMIAALALSVLLGTTAAEAGPDWPTYQHDVHRSGYSPAKLNPGRLELAWQVSYYDREPIIAGDTVYAQGAGTLTAYDLADGSVQWSRDVAQGGRDVSPVSYFDGRLYFSARDPDLDNTFLNVRDAATGDLEYRVDTGTSLPPAVYRHPTTGKVMGFIAGGSGRVEAWEFGPTSGTQKWIEFESAVSYGSVPTLGGDSVLFASTGSYAAIDQLTGSVNRFHEVSGLTGGSNTTVTFDPDRDHLYIIEDYESLDDDRLTAYQYNGQNDIQELWHQGPGGVDYNDPAVGPDGKVYMGGGDTIYQLDPDNGNLLGQITLPEGEELVRRWAPTLTDGYLWAVTGNDTSPTSGERTLVYDLDTLELIATLDDAPYERSTGMKGIGAFTDGYLVMHSGSSQYSGIRVYADTATVPEPGSLALLSLGAGGWLMFRRRRSASTASSRG